MPYFSIIIPVYNVAPYLRECLDSVMAQTFTDWEAICVDDGSSDDGYSVLLEYAEKDKRFVVVRQNNAGVVAARQKGFNCSTGRRIVFLDGDDLLSSEALEQLSAIEDDIEYVKFGFRYVNNGIETNVIFPPLIGLFSQAELLAKAKRSPLELLGMCVGDKCYKRDVVEKAFSAVGHVRIRHSEDGLFALAAFWASKKFLFVDDILYDYRYREASASHTFNPGIVADKEAFVAAAVNVAQTVGGQPEETCRNEFDYHAREALGHIFVMSLAKSVTLKQCYKLLKEMSESRFFRMEKSSWNKGKHWLMRFFVRYALVCISIRGLLRKVSTTR